MSQVMHLPIIIAIESISKKRQPYPSLEAIYFVSPTEESLLRIINDFSGNRPHYAACHIFFISSKMRFAHSLALEDNLFEKLKKSPASAHIKAVKELSVDYIGI